MSRRDFLRTSMASAATLLALGACSDDDAPSAGTFDLPPESTTEPDVATSVLGGDGEPIIDVQQHLLELEGFQGSFGSSFPQADCGDGRACFDTAHWLDLVFERSDTTMVVLSAIPVLGDPDPLSAEVMDAARRAASSQVRRARSTARRTDGEGARGANSPFEHEPSFTGSPGSSSRAQRRTSGDHPDHVDSGIRSPPDAHTAVARSCQYLSLSRRV
jgi:hypothetical protein